MSVADCISAAGAAVIAWEGDRPEPREDLLAVEEPLEIRLAGCSVAVTMRTPGDDLDLAAGFLLTEGIIRGCHDIASIAHCPTDDLDSQENIVNVNPSDPAIVEPSRWQRSFVATSSCGICGKAGIQHIRQHTRPIRSQAHVAPETLYRMAEELRKAQTNFHRTGGLHAAALFDLDGTMRLVREDIGRHNAVDKVIGAMLRAEQMPIGDSILLVSSRASFEIVQKALMAGIPIVAAVSAASSLAVELARAMDLTLAGFLRAEMSGRRSVISDQRSPGPRVPSGRTGVSDQRPAASGSGSRFNVYSGSERIENVARRLPEDVARRLCAREARVRERDVARDLRSRRPREPRPRRDTPRGAHSRPRGYPGTALHHSAGSALRVSRVPQLLDTE